MKTLLKVAPVKKGYSGIEITSGTVVIGIVAAVAIFAMFYFGETIADIFTAVRFAVS